MTQDRTCPNCGAALPPLLAHARMVNCEFCGSSIVLEDDVVRKAGEAGEMLDAAELIGLGRAVLLGDWGQFSATGHVRYDYGRGHWDEYYGQLSSGDMVWVSVDEGDVVIQRPVTERVDGDGSAFRLGAEMTVNGIEYTCTEVSNAKASAFRGQLPEVIVIGETHLYANYIGAGGAALSAERWTEPGAGVQMAWFQGHWIDPFEVRPA
ncbi:MAG: DUF4178 domain-containing protein [Pseudomonadota bacterium]